MGNLSFHSQHRSGSYTDHAGSTVMADSYADVTIHHNTRSFVAGETYGDDSVSQHGMDAIIYKVTEAGAPVRVFGVDALPADEVYNQSSVNGIMGGFAEFYGIASFNAESDMVAAGGLFRGRLTIPMNDGSNQLLVNTKDAGYGSRISTAPHLLWGGANGFITKVNMNTGRAMWATDEGLTTAPGNRYYVRTVTTTAAGHVLATADERIGRSYQGKFVKFNGANGAKVWNVTYQNAFYLYGVESDSTAEVAYVTGEASGTNIDPFSTGATMNTSSGGDAFVAALDVSGTAGPVAQWVVQIGSGQGLSVKASGNHLYLTGQLSAATTIGSCSLTGTQGGYLIKLNKADGSCVWAKDAPMGRGATAVTDGTSVWTFVGGSSPKVYDAQHTIYPNAESDDVFVAKYAASDGSGLWATSIGGTAKDRFADATMTPAGPVYVGYGQSDSVALGGLSIDNLQHRRAQVAGQIGSAWGPNRGGETALFSMQISVTDETPPCIASCPTGELAAADTTVVTGQCFANTECLTSGAFSTFIPCFQCVPTAGQKMLSGPVTVNYCYFDNQCVPTGTMAPNYQTRNDPSVCEWCAPSVNPTGWSLKPGYVHDRNFAEAIEDGQSGYGGPRPNGRPGQANIFGMLFEVESNGCQLMPDMPMPGSPTPNLAAALVNPTSGTVSEIAALASAAITAVRSATSTNQHAQIAWAHYMGNELTCTMTGDVCQHTPAATADTMGVAFATNLHYGHSVARVKVQQGLNLLDDALGTNAEPAFVANLTKDIVAHMLIPFYQGVIHAAHHMDEGVANARSDGAAYWQVINDAVGTNFMPDHRSFLTSMFASPASGTFNYCAASTRLMENLPAASSLQYHNYVRAGTMTASVVESAVHVTANDMGTLAESLVAAQPVACVMPPPAPPSDPPSPSPPPVPSPPTLGQASGGSDGGISDVVIIVVSILVVGALVVACVIYSKMTAVKKMNVKMGTPTPVTMQPAVELSKTSTTATDSKI